MVLAIVIALQLFSLLTVRDGHTRFGTALGGDLPGFYNAGRILVDYDPARLYDLQLQSRLYHDLLPTAPAGESLPYAHAPHFALPMAPLALLPYAGAYGAFLVVAPTAYWAGLRLIRPVVQIVRENDEIATLLVLSYLPFLIENWIGGQFAWFGFVWAALGVRCVLGGREFAGGVALSMCLYKPTLLIVMLPMLLVTRQLRVLLGVGVGAVAMAGVSLAIIGLDGCAAYIRLLLNYSGGADASAGFRTFKYVDILSFATLAGGGVILALVMAAGVVIVLTRSVWRYQGFDTEQRHLAWAAMLCLTPVLNVYAAVYDTLLPIIGLLLMADVCWRRMGRLADSLRIVLLLAYVVPWFSQALAIHIGFQPLTLVLCAAGMWCVRELRTSAAQSRHHLHSLQPAGEGAPCPLPQ